MREVLNTVGKPGKLGEHVRCVVSVSMLTEGWDCNTVTHILGVRAFGTRLLCEQVMGRGLRRRSYTVGDDGMMTPEYADIFGVPFSGFPVAGLPEERAPATPKPGKAVRAVPERLVDAPLAGSHVPARRRLPVRRAGRTAHGEVRRDAPRSPHHAGHADAAPLNAPIVGEKAELTLDEAKGLRPQTVAFRLATHLQQHHFPDRPWLFPQLLGIVRDWLGDPDGDSPNVDYGDDTFPGLLRVRREEARRLREDHERHHRRVRRGAAAARRAAPDRLPRHHGGRVVRHREGLLDDRPGEVPLQPRAAGQRLGNHRLREARRAWTRCGPTRRTRASASASRTPATGRAGNYYPDLIVKLDDGRGTADLLNLILEVSGQKKKEKDAKVQTAKTMWVPAVNNLGTFGRWAFLEIDGDEPAQDQAGDPQAAQGTRSEVIGDAKYCWRQLPVIRLGDGDMPVDETTAICADRRVSDARIGYRQIRDAGSARLFDAPDAAGRWRS